MAIVSLPDVQKNIKTIVESTTPIAAIVHEIHKRGARVLLVGGAVRDAFLGLPIKDLDIEVHGLTVHALEQLLTIFGVVSQVGKVYGVLRLHGLDVDWSLPRTDESGRKPVVTVDPHMSVNDAFARRDVTINAMGIDLVTYELIDPFNGLHDLERRILRSPDIRFFVEDPLRFYRVMQFISRFECIPDAQLNDTCRTMDIRGVSRERIEVECEKMLLKSRAPSAGLRWLHSIGRLAELFSELADTVGVEQSPQWHPEGDVFEHSMEALDAAAAIPLQPGPAPEHFHTLSDVAVYRTLHEKLVITYAALCHDLGKVHTTRMIDGKITSHGHELDSERCARRMLKRVTHNSALIDTVGVLVGHHMRPLGLIKAGAKPAAYKRLALSLAGHASMALLIKLLIADRLGRNPKGHVPLPLTTPMPDVEDFVKKVYAVNVAHAPEPALLQGRDFLDVAPPGPKLGQLVKRAYEIQIEEGITDKEELKRRVLDE